MCYSKDVQLVTGSAIIATSLYCYVMDSIKYHSVHKKWLKPFLNNVILGFMCIGGHQLFEFLTLQFDNQIIYKIGLILSISSMYFFIRSLEKLLNRNLHSGIALGIIGLVAVHAFSVDMSYSAYSFHLKHNSAYVWACAWMLLFIYFHVCAITGRKFLKDQDSKKEIMFYLFATLDISFLFSAAYTFWGYSNFSLDVCTAAPSIWCTFYVLQVAVLPFFLASLPKSLHSPRGKTVQTIRQTLMYFLLSVLILIFLVSFTPFFKCLSLKFVFP